MPIRSRSAFADGEASSQPSRAAVSFAHTPRYPVPGNRHIASTKYSPTREGSTRSRRSRVRVSSSTPSASSNGTIRVS